MTQYTQNYSLPYPEGNDAVAVHTDIEDLAKRADITLESVRQAATNTAQEYTDQELEAAITQIEESYVAGEQVRKITVSPNPYKTLQPGELLLVSETPKFFSTFYDTPALGSPDALSDQWAANYEPTVEYDETALGGKVLRLSSEQQGVRLLSIPRPDDLNDAQPCEIVLRWRASTINAIPRPLVWGSGSSGSETGVHAIYRTNGQLSYGRLINGSAGTYEGVQHDFTPDAWHITRVRVSHVEDVDYIRLQMSMWRADQPEPKQWDFEAAVGLLDVWAITEDNLPGIYFRGPGEALIDWVGVSWDYGAAPTPTVK